MYWQYIVKDNISQLQRTPDHQKRKWSFNCSIMAYEQSACTHASFAHAVALFTLELVIDSIGSHRWQILSIWWWLKVDVCVSWCFGVIYDQYTPSANINESTSLLLQLSYAAISYHIISYHYYLSAPCVKAHQGLTAPCSTVIQMSQSTK